VKHQIPFGQAAHAQTDRYLGVALRTPRHGTRHERPKETTHSLMVEYPNPGQVGNSDFSFFEDRLSNCQMDESSLDARFLKAPLWRFI
jgi:hypothetical protein